MGEKTSLDRESAAPQVVLVVLHVAMLHSRLYCLNSNAPFTLVLLQLAIVHVPFP